MNVSAPIMKRLVGAIVASLGGLLLLLLLFMVPVWVTVKCDRPPAATAPSALTRDRSPSSTEASPRPGAAITEALPANCKLRGQSLIGIPWRNKAIENLVGVELNFKTFRPGRVYRTYLYTYRQEIPVATYSVDYIAAQRTYDTIEQFLNTPTQQSMRAFYRPPWVTLITALLFATLMLGVGSFVWWI